MSFDRDVWEGRKPLAMPAGQLHADVALLDIGWTAWSCKVVDANEQAVGGVITQIRDQKTYDDDGEITEVRYFRALNPFLPVDHRGFVRTLVGAEIVLPDGVQPPDRQRLSILIMKLCRQVGRPHGWVTASDLDHLTDAWRIAAVIR